MQSSKSYQSTNWILLRVVSKSAVLACAVLACAVLACAALLSAGCVVQSPVIEPSPYELVYFEAESSFGVADGLTPVVVSVHGALGATLTIASTSAHFAGNDAAMEDDETTIRLLQADENGGGSARLQLVSTSPGLATLSLKLAPLAATLELEFAPLALLVDVPQVVGYKPGEVEYAVCVFSNSSRGVLRVEIDEGEISPSSSAIHSLYDTSFCIADEKRWSGASLFTWTSRKSSGALSAYYETQNKVVLGSVNVQIQGETFPGYEVVDRRVFEEDTWTELSIQLEYRGTTEFPGAPAGGVLLEEIRSTPVSLRRLGSSSGGVDAVPMTDSEGWVTLLFERSTLPESVSVFATPLGGGVVYLGEILEGD